MTAERYRDILAELGLGHATIAAMLRIDTRTSRRFANGREEIPQPVADWLELILSTRPSSHRSPRKDRR